MAENSKIEWTDHTFNPWVGCTKVSPACDNCYAEGWAKRSGRIDWGPRQRQRTNANYWRQPLKWDAEAKAAGKRAKVFCASLADVFDNDSAITSGWRGDLWALIDSTPNLDWLLLTKRPQNIRKFLPISPHGPRPNIWLGTTVENQLEAERRIPHLLEVKAAVHFVSAEPLLGPVDFTRINVTKLHASTAEMNALTGETWLAGNAGESSTTFQHAKIDWIIVGGESGPHARPMHPQWVRDIRDQCEVAGTAFHFKQWGEWAPGECAKSEPTRTEITASMENGEWQFGKLTVKQSLELHRDDEPDLYRLGKSKAGRWLDGVEHNGEPACPSH